MAIAAPKLLILGEKGGGGTHALKLSVGGCILGAKSQFSIDMLGRIRGCLPTRLPVLGKR